MKRIHKIAEFFAVALFAACLGLLVGCGKGETKLLPPQNLQVTDGILTWDEAAGAESYTVRVDGVGTDTKECRFDLFDVIETPKVYQIEVLSRSGKEGMNPVRSEILEDDVSGENYFWFQECEEGGYELKAASSVIKGTVVIPSEIKEKPVVKLAVDAFKGCKNVTAVYMPDSITELGGSIFSGCTELRRVRLSSRLTYLSASMFSDCKSLKEVELPDGLREIRSRVFYGSGLTEIFIPETVTEFSISNPFENCENLYRIEVSENNPEYYSEGNCIIRWDGQSLVIGCNGSVIPDGVRSIEERAFEKCNLEEIVLPDSLFSIGYCAFGKNKNLRRIEIPDSVAVLGESCFSGCINLESVTGMSGVISIERWAFSDCESLVELSLPSGLERIETSAFSRSGLKSFHLPETVIEIEIPSSTLDSNLFDDCKGLTEITCDENNPVFRAEGNCLIRREDSAVVAGCKTSVIPDGVKKIERKAFSSSAVTKMVFPASVTEIGKEAFLSVTELEEIALPEGVVSVGAYAFHECPELQSVTLPESVKNIGSNAFSWSTVYYSEAADTSGWGNEATDFLIAREKFPCRLAYNGVYPYVYSLDTSCNRWFGQLREEDFLIEDRNDRIELNLQIERYIVPKMSCQNPTDSLAFLGWTTEEGSGRIDYPVMQFDYTVTSNMGASSFEGMTFIYDVWGGTEEYFEFGRRFREEEYRPILYAVYGEKG